MWFKARRRREAAAEQLADAIERGAPEDERQAIIDAHVRAEQATGGLPASVVLHGGASLSGAGTLEGRVVTRDEHERIE